ncbi:MAG: glycosyltransferase family 2 protein [Syntrophomonadaceae bacterium]|nr:glycosyltransferase family 2 protein [Syntrophomonadaceae bacterium]
MNEQDIQYSIIVPLYNEELVIDETCKRLVGIMDAMGESYEIILVNDGSKDKTFDMARSLCRINQNIKLLSFSRNFGHQIAITAGMDYAAGAAVVVIDADLQDPPEVIPEMIAKWKEGYEVVYGQRIERKGETFFKRWSARLFYKILSHLTDVDVPMDVGDFRLIDRKVLEALSRLPERNRYVRGMVSWVGFKQIGVEFVRDERFAGETKYPLKKMLKFAVNAITSFSYKPLRIATYLGSLVSLMSFVYLFYVIYEKLFGSRTTVPGWASLAAISLFFNGIVLVLLGIIGEYIGRIYDEAKGRPLYIISEQEGFKDHEN